MELHILNGDGIKVQTVAGVDHCSTAEDNRNPLVMSCAGSTSQSREPETVAGCQVESVCPKGLLSKSREPETVAGCQVMSDWAIGSISKSRESEPVAGC
ncbi:hypothetical protein DPMN_135215 [Dreissena polymorpha]|uniref:Uncharacterized protein n=1 Tax=Dreissena polymorpha TaxID=45954 RepID=A0A9D4JGL2_DREPO|nr:hypothetical protein DPMN_135215 [Dreissena polymorpha]